MGLARSKKRARFVGILFSLPCYCINATPAHSSLSLNPPKEGCQSLYAPVPSGVLPNVFLSFSSFCSPASFSLRALTASEAVCSFSALTGASGCWGSLSRSPSMLTPRPSFADDMLVEVVDRQL